MLPCARWRLEELSEAAAAARRTHVVVSSSDPKRLRVDERGYDFEPLAESSSSSSSSSSSWESLVAARRCRKREAATRRFGDRRPPEKFERVLKRVIESGVIRPWYAANRHAPRIDWAALPAALDVGAAGGGLPEARRERKRRQLENIMGYVDAVARPGDVIVDFCCGGGHQSLPLAYRRRDLTFVLVDRKQRSLDVAERRVRDLGLEETVRTVCGDVSDFTAPFDVGMTLHACGGATDDVLDLCCARRAAFVVCPCCVGAAVSNRAFQNASASNYPRSRAFQARLSNHADYQDLAKAADTNAAGKTMKGTPPPAIRSRRLCKTIIEADRLEGAREDGFGAILVLMDPPSASPKNDIIVGWPLESTRGATLHKDAAPTMPWLLPDDDDDDDHHQTPGGGPVAPSAAAATLASSDVVPGDGWAS